MLDERTERLITRRLDGEITEDESLELDKRLIRSPEARATLEAQARIDALAGAALRAARCERPAGPGRQGEGAWAARTAARRYVWAGAAAAAAAVLAVLIGTLSPGGSRGHEAPRPPVLAEASRGPEAVATGAAVPVGEDVWPDLPRAGRHEILGVLDDETQSLYLLEMRSRPTAVSPATLKF